MRDIRNILDMIQENEKDVKPHLPESNPGETSDFVKNNARFAAHAEETVFTVKSEDTGGANDLVFHFGDANTHAGANMHM